MESAVLCLIISPLTKVMSFGLLDQTYNVSEECVSKNALYLQYAYIPDKNTAFVKSLYKSVFESIRIFIVILITT